MSEQDRRKRDLELLKGAVERDRKRSSQPEAKPSSGGSVREGVMYRGQPVAGRGGRGGRAPGAPAGGGGRAPSSSSGSADVKSALQKLSNLFNDGLITQAEYDAKRSEILDRI